jgi:hypothetical protein
VVTDAITADKPVTITWLNHTLSRPECLEDGSAVVRRNGVTMDIKPVKGLKPTVKCTGRFAIDVNEGIAPGFEVETPPQYHLRWESEAAQRHEIVMEYTLHLHD